MNKIEYNTNPTSLDRIYVRTHISTIYFSYKTPDEIIDIMERIKRISEEKKYKDVQIYSDSEDNFDGEGHRRTYIGAQGYRLETDKEYKSRLSSILATLEKSKRDWESRKEFFYGEYDGSWTDKTFKYKTIIDAL